MELNKEVKAVQHEPAKLALLEEMMKAGLALGKRGAKTHPRMRPFVFGARGGMEIIDLEETLVFLEKAVNFIKEKISKKATILLVGTTPVVSGSVKETAQKLNLSFVTVRWLGGTLTNFKTISKRIAYFKKLKSDKEAGRWDKYTKKEKLNFDRQIEKMNTMFSGLENMDNLPDAIFVIDVNKHIIVVREADRLRIPVIGVMNTDTNPELVAYPIPANDRSKQSAEWILQQFEKAVNDGRKSAAEAVLSAQVPVQDKKAE